MDEMDATAVVGRGQTARPPGRDALAPGAAVNGARNADGHLDPITFELVYAGLISAAEEMGGMLKRSSHSPIIRDMEDFSCAVFAADGASSRRPTSSRRSSVRCRWSSAPCSSAGVTSIDMTTSSSRTTRTWARCTRPTSTSCSPSSSGPALRLDRRDRAPSGRRRGEPRHRGPDLREVYAEGVILPPVRLVPARQDNRDIFDLLTENVRDPVSTISDLRAQRAACLLGERRIARADRSVRKGAIANGFRQATRRGRASDARALSSCPTGRRRPKGSWMTTAGGVRRLRIHARL